MGLVLLFSSVLMAGAVWWLVKQSVNVQPWVAQGSVEEVHDGVASWPAAKIGLWVFLAVVAMLFLLLITAYAGRMAYEIWRPVPQLSLLWANTFVLILCSFALQWARISVRRGQMDGMRVGLLAGGALTVVFLLGQIVAWRQLATMDYFEVTNPAIAFFYLITGLHGLHLLGGLVAWGRTAARVWGHFDVASVKQSVELCAVYWHFLLVVWLALFGLLFAGNNLDLLLTICGIR
ncbi:MAG: cytochrome c oxidase subunit 3 [Betaproteobacteria bacterium]